MLILFFSWWYGYLLRRLYLAFQALIITLLDLFSLKILFKTLFAPWKRDVLSYEGLSIQQKFQAFAMNMASRFIGFVIKIFVFLAFAIMFTASVVIFLAAFGLWLIFPLAVIALLIFGIINIASGS